GVGAHAGRDEGPRALRRARRAPALRGLPRRAERRRHAPGLTGPGRAAARHLRGRAGPSERPCGRGASALEGLRGRDPHGDLVAVGGGVARLVAHGLAVDRGTERRRRRVHVEVGRAGDLARAEQERHLVTRDDGGDDHAGLDLAVVRRRADPHVAQLLGELTDAALVLGLLLARGVAAAVLLAVALVTGSGDARRDLLPALGGP